MANDVTFRIKIEVTGEENVRQVTLSAEELGKVVNEVADEQKKLNTQLLDINQAQQAIEGVTSGINQLVSELQIYTSAYSVQEQAEARLAQVMRNTMSASDAEIESIKALCSAQQELGVIGDEVQLSGAQELGTYLEKKSSLERLIPVMNDMLAQQYGVNATEEEAVTIATMLGKVMEGQTSALSRYGYSFDAVQEQILKFGTEEQRAAVLASVVSASVGGMNATLAQTDAGKARQTANTIGDIKEEVGRCVARMEPLLASLGDLGNSVNGAMRVINGFRGISSAIQATRASMTLCQAAAAGLRVAIRGLLVASGVGIAITALTFAIEKLSGSSARSAESSDTLSGSLADETATLDQARAALELNIAKLKDFHGSKEQEKKVVEEMNNTYGETMGYFNSVASWYDALVKNSEAYCRQMVVEARTRMLANQIAQKEQETHSLMYDERGQVRRYSTKREKKRYADGSSLSYAGAGDTGVRYEEIAGTSDMDKVVAKIRENNAAVANMKKRLQDELANAGQTDFKVKGSAVRPAPSGDAGGTGGHQGGGRNREISLRQEVKTYEDLQNNIRYYDQELAKTQITDEASIKSLARKKAEAEELMKRFEALSSTSILPEVPQTLGDYDVLIADAQERRSRATKEQLKDLDSEIAKLEAARNELEQSAHADLTVEGIEEAVTSYGRLRAEQQYYQHALEQATTDTARQEIEQLLAALERLGARWQKTADELRTGVPTIGGVEDSLPTVLEKGSAEDKRQSYQNAKMRVERLEQDLELHIIGKEEAEESLKEVNAQLEALGLKPIEIKLKTDQMKEAEAKMKAATDAVGQMGQSLDGLGDALELPELNVAGTLAQAIATMVQGYATATAQSATMGPWVWLGFGATGLAQLAAMVSAVKKIGKYANGGVAYGPTLGLFGEYANAGQNPEVVAPLDKLRSIIGIEGNGGASQIELKVRGRNLVGVTKHELRLKSRG